MAPTSHDSTFHQVPFTTTNHQKPPPKITKLSLEPLQRTISDISFELISDETEAPLLPPISEIEEAKCECCGMSEECTSQYVRKVRDNYCGRMICGLCSAAVKDEMDKNGGTSKADAVRAHVSACARFNRLGRAYPVLCQAEAMRKLLRNSRAKSLSPRDKRGSNNNNKIARSSSCIPAITKEMP